jgi:hypothetical protein
MNDDVNHMQTLLWKVSYSDVSMYFESRDAANHNYEAFKRAGLDPRMEEYQLIRTFTS